MCKCVKSDVKRKKKKVNVWIKKKKVALTLLIVEIFKIIHNHCSIRYRCMNISIWICLQERSEIVKGSC